MLCPLLHLLAAVGGPLLPNLALGVTANSVMWHHHFNESRIFRFSAGTGLEKHNAAATAKAADSSNCTGSSAALPPAECAAFHHLFDATGGPKWSPNCGTATTRSDPCSCVRVRCDRIAGHLHITQLRLDANGLVGSIPQEIGNFAQLTELYFFFNRLRGPLPAQIGNLGRLTELLGCCNEIDGTIPGTISKLNKLKQLDLSCNNMSGIIPKLRWQLYSSGCFLGGPQLANCPPRWNASRNWFACPLPADIPASCQASCKTDDAYHLNRSYLSTRPTMTAGLTAL